MIVAASRSHLDSRTKSFLDGLTTTRCVLCGSSLKLCRIAEGEFDLYPRLAPTHEWDVAAGHAILAAAGGLVVQPDGSQLTYGNAERDYCIPGFVAGGDPTAMRRLLERVHWP